MKNFQKMAPMGPKKLKIFKIVLLGPKHFQTGKKCIKNALDQFLTHFGKKLAKKNLKK